GTGTQDGCDVVGRPRSRPLSAGCSLLAAVGLALLRVGDPRVAQDGHRKAALLGPRPIDPAGQGAIASPALFLGLLAYYVAITVPFLLGGLAVAAPLSAHPTRADRLYAADLFGAGLGCLAAVAALTWTDGASAVALCAAVFMAAAACYAVGRRERVSFAVVSAALVLAAPFAERVIHFMPAPSKALGIALRRPNTEVYYTRWSPVNRVDVYRTGDSRGGWWGTAGLSKDYRGKKPRTLTIQYDGHNGSDVFDTREPETLAMLDAHLLRTPYAVREQDRVLVIGIGGGIDVLNALRRGASQVTGVDLQPITIDLHRSLFSEWTSDLAHRPEVTLVAGEGRHFARSGESHFDLVQITAVDTFSAQTTGAYVLAESYLYTVEAFQDYFDRLADDGMVSIILGDAVQPYGPPLLLTRLALVGREALTRSGVSDPNQHMLVVTIAKGLKSANHSLMVKKTPFTDEELARVKRFVSENGFRVDVSPELEGQLLARVVHATPAERETLLEQYDLVLDPSTDDQPFFFNVLPWSSLVGKADIYWMFPGSSTGLLVLAMMLTQALLLGAVLILLPLVGKRERKLAPAETTRFLLYFLGLGLGFMLIEISFVQKYVLLLGYPTYSLSVTIFSLIVSAACGAALCRRAWGRPRRFLLTLLGVTVTLVALEVGVLGWIRDAMLGASLTSRIATTMALQFPLGFVLGMYFPTGLELLRRHEPRLVPWAWAVNGVASVAATVLAVILGMQLGFTRVALLAAVIYAIGTLSLWSGLPADRPART
ncbi:MAG: hypothetical protein ABFS41_13770, partial [Myxococcota bacterium]